MNWQDILHARHVIEEILRGSSIPEDPGHAVNTLEWLLTLEPDAGAALRLAALGHDIERAYPDRRVQRSHFPDFDMYKAAHATNSARILGDVLASCSVDQAAIGEVQALVARHESGGTPRSDLLAWADSLSFFDHNLPFYAERHTEDEIRHRVLWGLLRLPPPLRHKPGAFAYPGDRLRQLVNSVQMELVEH